MARPGGYVRTMAKERRYHAVVLVGLAGLGALSLFAVLWVSKASGLLFLICLLPIALSIQPIRHQWRRAKQADQGAAGEEAIAALLTPLSSQGWTINYGICEQSVGDIDVFMLSPHGKAYTIDVKSHRGIVRYNGKQLYRYRRQMRSPFNKDFLQQAKRQAIAIKTLKNLAVVTPMVAFSNAKVEVGDYPIEGVHVVEKSALLRRLHYLEGAPPKKRKH